MPRATDQEWLEPHYAWLAGGIALVILYCSFYPFGFYVHHDPRGPVGVLLDSRFHSPLRDDVVSNIFFYIPFGFFVACAVQKRILVAVSAGLALSLFVELMQFYDIGRVQDISDVWSNTLGAFLGGIGAVAARRRTFPIFVTLMLGCWLASRWYPASPTGAGSMLDLFRYFAAWLAVGVMLEALCGASRSRAVLPILLGVSLLLRAIAAFVEPAEIAGGAAAALIWGGLLWRVGARAKIAAALFVALVILLALAPFHFLAIPRAFGWVPFRSFIEAGTPAVRVFFEKAFLYGAMIWLLSRAGLSIGIAAVCGGVLVFGLRLLQVYLPGRSAEITDAVLLLMLAGMMKLISMAKKPEGSPDSA